MPHGRRYPGRFGGRRWGRPHYGGYGYSWPYYSRPGLLGTAALVAAGALDPYPRYPWVDRGYYY